MQLIRERVLREGRHLGGGIIKVDSFVNHQLDPLLMKAVGEEFARCFAPLSPTKILTAESSGIAPALTTGIELGIPVLFARKHQPVTMPATPYRAQAESHTHGNLVELIVSPEFLLPEDRVLIIDDFLATARTILGLVRLVEESRAQLVGIGAVVEKSFEGGREALEYLAVPLHSLAIIDGVEGERLILRQASAPPSVNEEKGGS